VREPARAGRLLLAVLAAGLLAAAPARLAAQAEAIRVGSHAPALDLTDCRGEARRVAWEGKGPAATIVYFFDPQVPDALLGLSFLDALHARARDFGLSVVAIEGKGRQPAEVTRSMERYCLVYRDPSFAVLPDPSFRAGRLYGVGQLPAAFLMESHGVVLNRIEGYDHAAAVTLVRRVEQLLSRERGYFSSALRDAGVTADEEREIQDRAAAAAGEGAPPAVKPLAAGDRAPAIDFTDLAGRSGRWEWPAGADGLRIVFFWGGLSLASIEEMTWLDELARRGLENGLEILAVEATGLEGGAIQEAMTRYRRFHPAPAFPLVADPGKRIGALFGAGDPLPQTFVLARDGAVIYRADRFEKDEPGVLLQKVERAFALLGRPLPPPRGGGGETLAPVDAEEAPSIRAGREREERFRSNLVQGDAHFMNWDFDRALPYYLQALEVQPRDLHALLRTAQIYERQGDTAKAIDFWERVLAVRADNEEARARLKVLRAR
jgi:hypothetical protein